VTKRSGDATTTITTTTMIDAVWVAGERNYLL